MSQESENVLKELCKALGLSESIIPALQTFCQTIYKHGYQDGVSDTCAEFRKITKI